MTASFTEWGTSSPDSLQLRSISGTIVGLHFSDPNEHTRQRRSLSSSAAPAACEFVRVVTTDAEIRQCGGLAVRRRGCC